MRTLLAIATIVLAPVPARAEAAPTLCFDVARSGAVGPPVHLGPECVPVFTPPATCEVTRLSTTPLNEVVIMWCLPR